MPIVAFFKKHRRWLLIPPGLLVLVIVLAVIAVPLISPRLTPYLEGPEFRTELDKQTSKGLHFDGKFGEIKRTGMDTAWVGKFQASDGVKAMKSMEAEDVSAKFNPWGVLLRRWQLDYIHIKRGKVEVQTYEPKPDPKKHRPWYAIFLPERVYLKEVTCETADVTWRMQGKPGGIFGTKVLITPYGRDFEYQAEGGTMKTGGLTPELSMRRVHMVITKKILELYELHLAPLNREKGFIRVKGEMGMRENKHVDMTLEYEDIPLAPWLPKDLEGEIRGLAKGEVHWKGTDQTIEASSGEGEFAVAGGELIELPILEFLASSTARKSLKTISLTACKVKFRWKYPRFEITELNLTGKEKVALRGSAVVNKGRLSGELELGLAPTYLDWLPRAKEEIFTKQSEGMIWTTVKLSGTLKEPVDDLTPRLAEALKKDPAAATGLFFRNLGEWFEQKLRGRKTP